MCVTEVAVFMELKGNPNVWESNKTVSPILGDIIPNRLDTFLVFPRQFRNVFNYKRRKKYTKSQKITETVL